MSVKTRRVVRKRIKTRIRKRLSGDAARPRLAVFRSERHIYAQVIDDDAGSTLCSASTLDKDLRGRVESGSDIGAAEAVGTVLAERAKKKGLKRVGFDRGGFRFHGRVKALADAARKGGLEF